MFCRRLAVALACALSTAAFSAPALAQFRPDMGKLLATGGVSQIEGAGGGGLTPWALIGGYGTRDSYGANLHATTVSTQDYSLQSYGFAVGFADRVELSLANQVFSGSKVPLNDLRIRQNIAGIKVKIAGDAVYGQDSLLPQIAIGAMAKDNKGIKGLGGVTNVRQLGARHDSGVDYYLSATKILLQSRLLLNGTLRATKANQMGLLGFGGDRHDRYEIMPEVSVAYLLTRHLVAGAEYRRKPRNLTIDSEKDYYDMFLAYFPSKHFSITAAFVDLGNITVLNPTHQRGFYLSLQAGF